MSWVPAGGGSTPGSIPSGLIAMWHGLLVNVPAGWALCDGTGGTPDLRSSFVKGAAAGVDPGVTGGATSHSHSNHAVTQPNAHAVTQPSAHSNHAVTQPNAHAVTQPGAHSNHVVTQPGAHSNHVVTQPDAHAAILNHVHVQQAFGGTTAATTGTHLMTSTATGGSLRSSGESTLNPTSGGAATMPHANAAVDAHSAHSGSAVDAHSAHSGTAVDAHAGTAVDAHSAHSGTAVDAHAGTAVDAHSTSSNEPVYFAVAFIMKL